MREQVSVMRNRCVASKRFRSRRLNVQQGGGGLQVSRDVTSHCGRELSQFVYMRGAEGGRVSSLDCPP
ncbi:hypothetical protein O3P69_006165 [Scylla paramamosain]|uniref:Uncharacterized protein n=1 Tax=Scylla paramamosain TaxID=85552 RepID=A0AAW0UAB1_SCYPA